jgi:hypothetical protein
MTPPAESPPHDSAFDRKKRRAQELNVLEEERLRLHKAKRRSRRELRPPRLSYVESPSGWTLTVPPNADQVRLLVRTTAVAAAAIVATLVLEHSWGARGISLFLGVLLPFMFAMPYLSGLRRTTWIDVGKDGQITIHGRRASNVLHRGQARTSTVRVDFENRTALAEWKVISDKKSNLTFQGCGDRDIQVLKEFCAAARIPVETARPEEAEKAAFLSRDERRSQIKGFGFLFTGLAGFLVLLAVAPTVCRVTDQGENPFANKSLKGSFHSANKELGEWTLTPGACLSGSERGFEGVAFLFPAGAPVEEIHVDTAREGDNVVEIRLADRTGTVARYRERECQVMDGVIDRTNVVVNGRHMFRLKGNTRFSCPAQGLSGSAEFDGCLPQ